MEDLRYPIGKLQPQESYSADDIKGFIERIGALPAKLEQAVAGMTDAQLDTPYRDGGWTVRQVVHHVGDSHTHSFIRIKWTITESTPVIKAYDEKAWAEQPDYKLPIGPSLEYLKALHVKMTNLMRLLSPDELKKEFTHPETKKNVALSRLIHTYAWHGEHHLAHITSLKERKGWK